MDYKVSTLDFGSYSTHDIENDINSATNDGFELAHMNSHYEPINAAWRVLLIYKRTQMAEAIYGK